MSGFAFGGIPARALRTALTSADVYVSEDLLAEYREVPEALRASRKVTAGQWQALMAGIAAFVAEARVVKPTSCIKGTIVPCAVST